MLAHVPDFPEHVPKLRPLDYVARHLGDERCLTVTHRCDLLPGATHRDAARRQLDRDDELLHVRRIEPSIFPVLRDVVINEIFVVQLLIERPSPLVLGEIHLAGPQIKRFVIVVALDVHRHVGRHHPADHVLRPLRARESRRRWWLRRRRWWRWHTLSSALGRRGGCRGRLLCKSLAVRWCSTTRG